MNTAPIQAHPQSDLPLPVYELLEGQQSKNVIGNFELSFYPKRSVGTEVSINIRKVTHDKWSRLNESGTNRTQQFPILLDKARTIKTISNYSSLGRDWDGYGGRPLFPHAIKAAIQFINSMDYSWPLPVPGPAGDGEVNLVWNRDGFFIDVGFHKKGKASYFAETPSGEKYYGDDVDISSNHIPDELAVLLSVIRK